MLNHKEDKFAALVGFLATLHNQLRAVPMAQEVLEKALAASLLIDASDASAVAMAALGAMILGSGTQFVGPVPEKRPKPHSSSILRAH